MSKSKKNVVDPTELVDLYGADTVRMFCLFASPPERDLEWNDQGVEGSFRFLHKTWRLVIDNMEAITKVPTHNGQIPLSGDLQDIHRKTHETIKKVSIDIENRFHFNTAISAVMELINDVTRFLNTHQVMDNVSWSVVREALETTVLLLSPVVPHIMEELWQMMGHDSSILLAPWPEHDEGALKLEKRLIVLQVNGKVRSRMEIPVSFSDEQIEAAALEDERVRKFMGESAIKKVIVVGKKLVNIVV
jgi:leucyl-tRNA synthetase